jgi:cytochrome c556
MGQGAPGFTEQALDFHKTAEAIEEAARAEDGTAVMRALGDTLIKCNGCHGSYRQQLVGALP